MEKLKREVERQQMERARKPTRFPWYILRPNAPIVLWRDIILTLGLFGVLLVVPFELGFVESPDEPDPTAALWVFNRVLDSIFWIDILFNLFVSFELAPIDEELAEEAQRTISGGGSSDVLAYSARYEGRLSRIWLAYAKGWFILDIASSIPSMVDIHKVYELYHGEGSVDGDRRTNLRGGNDDGSMALMRLGRTAKLGNFLKLVKILKVLRIAKIGKLCAVSWLSDIRDRATVAMIEHTRKMRILRILLAMLCSVHLLACLLGLSTLFADQKIESFWGTHGYCWEDRIVGRLADGRAKYKCVNEWRQYLTAFCYALSCVFGFDAATMVLNGGPGTPYFYKAHAVDGDHDLWQVHELVIFLFVNLVGALLGLYITGAFVSVVNGDNLTISEEVTRFCKRYGVQHAKRHELQRYFALLGTLEHTMPKPDLFFRISPHMRWQLVLDIHGRWLSQLPFFALLYDMPSVHFCGRPVTKSTPTGDQTEFLCAIALQMQPTLYIPNEVVQPMTFVVVVKGLVFELYEKKILQDGQPAGSLSMLLGAPEAHRLKALTMTQAISLSHKTLMQLLDTRPDLMSTYCRLRVWARYKLLFRHIRRLAYMKLAARESLIPGECSPAEPSPPEPAEPAEPSPPERSPQEPSPQLQPSPPGPIRQSSPGPRRGHLALPSLPPGRTTKHTAAAPSPSLKP